MDEDDMAIFYYMVITTTPTIFTHHMRMRKGWGNPWIQELDYTKQMVMPFGVIDGPPTFQRAINKTFRKYLDQFMKIFLDDFIIYSDMESHLMKLRFFF